MATTYEIIASETVGSGGAANIEFTSIPATYTDLSLVFSARSVRAVTVEGIYLYFNNDTTNGNYTYKRLYGTGSTAGSDSSILVEPGASATASTFGNANVYIPNYTSSNAKSFSGDAVTENNATSAEAILLTGRWSGTSAITSIKLVPESANNFAQYSTAYLYGISNA
jgi:hypothetical protein